MNDAGSPALNVEPRSKQQAALDIIIKAKADIERLSRAGDTQSAFLIAEGTIKRVYEVLR
jgi:hypothetical protein